MRSLFLFILSVSSCALITGCGGRNDPPAAFSYGTAAPLDKSHRKIVIQPGQSLSFIARKYGTTEESITTLNNLPLDAVLRVGQEIYLPKNLKPRSKKIAQIRAKPKPSSIQTAPLEPLEPLESIDNSTLKNQPKMKSDEWVDVDSPQVKDLKASQKVEKLSAGSSLDEKKEKSIPQKKQPHDDFFDTIRDEEINAELKSLKTPEKKTAQPAPNAESKASGKKTAEPFDPSKNDEDTESSQDEQKDDVEKDIPLPVPSTDKILKLPAKQAEKSSSSKEESTQNSSKVKVQTETKTSTSSDEPKETVPFSPASETSPTEPVEDQATTADPAQFSWPLPFKGEITLSFNQVINGAKNDGININVPRGTPINAIGEGTIVHASPVKGFGNLILIKHNDTWMSAYGHMDKILVKQGSKIKKGQKIGTVGQTGYVKTPQLHFELRQASKPIDPTKYITP
ncbi:MAG: peptidoglycan DD-metalloendopeptidase family protein [Caedimonadaceae bacterium]|nr:MAG: peptidoglycan DD-metalloendopeptidase family protein [Caedimonadaceae bacterium]